MKFTISVIMAVYNGQKYIEEQINSIINQTKRVDEIIIIDDCSSKKCTEIIERISNKLYRTFREQRICADIF